MDIIINIAWFRCVLLDFIWQPATECETAEHLDGAFGLETDHGVSDQKGIQYQRAD